MPDFDPEALKRSLQHYSATATRNRLAARRSVRPMPATVSNQMLQERRRIIENAPLVIQVYTQFTFQFAFFFSEPTGLGSGNSGEAYFAGADEFGEVVTFAAAAERPRSATSVRTRPPSEAVSRASRTDLNALRDIRNYIDRSRRASRLSCSF